MKRYRARSNFFSSLLLARDAGEREREREREEDLDSSLSLSMAATARIDGSIEIARIKIVSIESFRELAEARFRWFFHFLLG